MAGAIEGHRQDACGTLGGEGPVGLGLVFFLRGGGAAAGFGAWGELWGGCGVVAVADFEEDAGEVFHGGDAECADAAEDVAVGVGCLAADDDRDLVWEETAETDHLVWEVWVIGRVDDAEGDGADVVHHDGADDFFCWEGGAEVGDVPAGFASEACGDGGAHFVELAGWGGDEEARGGFRGVDRAEGSGEIVFDGAGGAMFLGGGDFAALPVCAEALEEGDEETFEHAGVAHG